MLTQWLTSSLADTGPRQVAWLSLDAGDDDLRQFLTHLIASLQTIRPDLGVDALALLDFDRSIATTAVLVSLVNDLDRSNAATVIALDDYHVIGSAAVHEAVTFLIDTLPAPVTLAITSRIDPPLPLSRLRARGELLELRATDLRFNADEAETFLNKVMALDLEPAQVAALEARTEGWAAGLQLAGLSARGRTGDPEAVSSFVRAFTGSNRFVLDYLLEEVLRSQPDEIRSFLLDTSILPELTGSLCDALTGRGDGHRMLEELERSHLFVISLDDQRQWFRYHQLFADALRAQLASEHGDRAPVLHLAAAQWHADRGQLTAAIPHALAGGDDDDAAELIELALPTMRRHRQDHLMREWLQTLPRDVVRRRALLATFLAWSRLSEGDLAGVETWLDVAEAASSRVDIPSPDDHVPALMTAVRDRAAELRMVPALIEVYRASVAQARGNTVGAIDHAARALALVGPDDHFTRGAAAGFLGLGAWATGDLSTAVDTFADAITSLTVAGNGTDALGATVVLASMWSARGRPDEAERLYRQALETAEQHPGAVLPVTGDLHVGLADMLRERGDLERADEHLRIAHDLGDPASLLENRHRWFTVAAGLRRARGDHDGAIAMLEEAESLYLPGYLPNLQPIPAVKARVRITQGKWADAWDWAHSHQVSVTDHPTYLSEFTQLTLARLLVAQHSAASKVDAAVKLADRILAAAEAADRGGSMVDALIVRALAQQTRGVLDAAVDDLSRALATATPGGYAQLFLDEGTVMVNLLRAAAAHPAVPGAERAEELLRIDSRHRRPRQAAGSPSLAHEGLSDRELDVLRLLATDLTGPEIARHLFVSVNTLRTHTKHIFAKLEVNTRPAAVRRATSLGLL